MEKRKEYEKNAKTQKREKKTKRRKRKKEKENKKAETQKGKKKTKNAKTQKGKKKTNNTKTQRGKKRKQKKRRRENAVEKKNAKTQRSGTNAKQSTQIRETEGHRDQSTSTSTSTSSLADFCFINLLSPALSPSDFYSRNFIFLPSLIQYQLASSMICTVLSPQAHRDYELIIKEGAWATLLMMTAVVQG